jgi:hypothetical protein
VLASEAGTGVGSAAEVLTELRALGYALSVITCVDVHGHKVGPQPITYADKLWVEGPETLPDELRAAIREHRDELLAVTCVINPPPVRWLRILVGRCRSGRAVVPMLAANVAGFMGLHPGEDGPRLEPIIEEALG